MDEINFQAANDEYKKGNIEASLSMLDTYVQSSPNDSKAYFLLGTINHHKGLIGKAIKSFSKVLEIEPAHTDAAICLSVIYNDIGKYDEAKKIFERANERVKSKNTINQVDDLHINKKFSFKHFELAEMYFTYGRFEEAMFEYNKSSILDPDNLDIRIKIAKVYSKRGFVGKAIDELKRLKNESPAYLPARIALGVIYYGNGNILEAQLEWEKVIAKEPNNSEAQMYMNLSKAAKETNFKH